MDKLIINRWLPSGLYSILILLFGLVSLFFPGITLKGLAIYFAITIIIGGISLVIGSFRINKFDQKWPYLLIEGIIGVILGIIVLAEPEISVAIFTAIIGIWIAFVGVILFMAYRKSKEEMFENKILLFSSLLSLLIGIIIVINPFDSARIVAVLIGLFATAYGIISLMNTIKMRKKT